MNVNSWTEDNCTLKEKMILANNPDVVCITETHLRNETVINVENYSYIGLNQLTNKQTRNFGGVGILYKSCLKQNFRIEKCYEFMDNLLGIKFVNVYDNETIVIYCVYLPPEGSKHANNNEVILNNLTIEVYLNQEANSILICGDFNARIGSKSDCAEWDEMPNRAAIDKQTNSQGEKLLTMVSDIRGCIINGRVKPENDDFTSVASHKGLAVVDYVITRQCDLESVLDFNVKSPIQLIDEMNLQHMINDRSHPPDHSLLTVEIELSTSVKERLCGNTLGSKEYKKKKTIRKVGEEYMENDTALRMLDTLMSNFEQVKRKQKDIDNCYCMLTDFLLSEAESSSGPLKKKRENTKYKQYWDDTLSTKCRHMKDCEKDYRNIRKKGKKQLIECKRKIFKEAQHDFDKTLKWKKRQFCRGKMITIENCCVSDPNAFWKFIKNLGLKKSRKIPMEVEVNGTISVDENVVLEKWRNDFKNLYKISTDNFDDTFKENIINNMKRSDLSEGVENDCSELNVEIRMKEVREAVYASKNKKAVGLDNICNEILKHEVVVVLLTSLFNMCM